MVTEVIYSTDILLQKFKHIKKFEKMFYSEYTHTYHFDSTNKIFPFFFFWFIMYLSLPLSFEFSNQFVEIWHILQYWVLPLSTWRTNFKSLTFFSSCVIGFHKFINLIIGDQSIFLNAFVEVELNLPRNKSSNHLCVII